MDKTFAKFYFFIISMTIFYMYLLFKKEKVIEKKLFPLNYF